MKIGGVFFWHTACYKESQTCGEDQATTPDMIRTTKPLQVSSPPTGDIPGMG